MRLVLAAIVIAAGAACYRGPEAIPSEKVAPLVTRQPAAAEACADSQYLRLPAIPADSLSRRVYEQLRIGPEDIPPEKVAPPVTRQPAATEACADSLYLRLLAIPVDSLSPRVYEQFRIRDAACVASRVPARQP